MEDALRLSVSEVKGIKKDYAELYEQFKHLAAHATSLQQLYDTSLKKNESLKRKLRDYESTRKTFEDDVLHLGMASRLLEKREKDVEDTLATLRENLLAQRGMNELLEKEIEDLKHIMSTEYLHVDAHRRLLENVDDDYKSIVKRNELLMTDLDNNFVRKEEFQSILKQLNEVVSERDELEKKCLSSQRKESESVGALHVVTEQLANVKTDLLIAQTKLTDAFIFQERHHSCEENAKHAAERLLACETAKASLQAQLGNESLGLQREKDVSKALQDQLTDLRVKYNELNAERIELKLELQQVLEEKSLQAAELHDAKLAVAALNEKNQYFLGQKAEAENLCEEIHNKKNEMEVELVRMKEENVSLHRKILDTAPELEYLRSQIDEFRNAVLTDVSQFIDLGQILSPGKVSGLEYLGSTYANSHSPSPSSSPLSQGIQIHQNVLSTRRNQLNAEYDNVPTKLNASQYSNSDNLLFPLQPHEEQLQQRLQRQLDLQDSEFKAERNEIESKRSHSQSSSSKSSRRADDEYRNTSRPNPSFVNWNSSNDNNHPHNFENQSQSTSSSDVDNDYGDAISELAESDRIPRGADRDNLTFLNHSHASSRQYANGSITIPNVSVSSKKLSIPSSSSSSNNKSQSFSVDRNISTGNSNNKPKKTGAGSGRLIVPIIEQQQTPLSQGAQRKHK